MIPSKIWGQLRAFRNRRRIAEVERICLSQTVEASKPPLPGGHQRPLAKGEPLRRMLLIADVMWEANELVPDLSRICEVVVHNVRPALRNPAGTDPQECIRRSLSGFIQQHPHQTPDLILLYLRGNLLSEELFALLRKYASCPLLGLNLDDKAHFWDYGTAGGGDHYQRWAPFFDLNLTNSKIAEDWYRQANAPVLYLPPAMKTPVGITSPAKTKFNHLLSFVGSPKLDREVVVNRLRDAQLPITVFGKGWPGGMWVEDPVTVYRDSQLNLGLGMATPHLSTTKNRDFECPGVGACYITTFNWELPEWWDIGKEILCYRNVEELIEIVCWYRQRPDECHKIAHAAWRRGNAEHTWELRFRKLFDQIGFDVATSALR